MPDQEKVDALEQEIRDLQEKLADQEKRLPAHSIRPHQLIELEELENLIEEKKADLEKLKRED